MSLFWTVLLGTALLFAASTVITTLLIKAAPKIDNDELAGRMGVHNKPQGRARSARVDWRHFDRVVMRRKNRDEESTKSVRR